MSRCEEDEGKGDEEDKERVEVRTFKSYQKKPTFSGDALVLRVCGVLRQCQGGALLD